MEYIFRGSELERLTKDNQRILEEGQKIIQNNNLAFDKCQKLIDEMNATLNHTSNVSQSNNSLFNQFIERGRDHHDYTQGILDPNYWANFVLDVIKKTLWLLWQGFMGLSHWLCILIAVAGILAYIAGYKKGGVISICSIIFYIFIKLINMLIGG